MPRKTARGVVRLAVVLLRASMRPRPDAAENRDVDGPGRADPGASMRQRPDAAENAVIGRTQDSAWRLQ